MEPEERPRYTPPPRRREDEERRDDSAWVKTPGGFAGGVSGTNTILFVAIAALAGLALWFQTTEHRRLEDTTSRLAATQQAIVREMQTANYLLATPQDHRPRLPLPWHLRQYEDGGDGANKGGNKQGPPW